MAPFSMCVTRSLGCTFPLMPPPRRCNTCGEYVYKGKKFNARKETVDGEDYYGIKIFRFYIKWYAGLYFPTVLNANGSGSTLCSAEITFKTDPKNTDYTAEHGASRNFEPWREEREVEEVDRLAKLEEEENNPMKVLENRTTDSKREMDILDALQDIRARNARNERVGNSSVDLLARIGVEELENEEDMERKRIEEEDEKLVREVFAKVTMPTTSTAGAATDGEDAAPAAVPTVVTVKRKAEDVEPSLLSLLPDSARSLISSKTSSIHTMKKAKLDNKKSLGIVVKKGKAKA